MSTTARRRDRPLGVVARIAAWTTRHRGRVLLAWRHHDATAAVHHGMSTTGRVITAAAAIMICVFGSFALGDNRDVKLFGISMASAVFLDAFVVRSLLLPSVLQLLGPRTWWMPDWLRRRTPGISIDAEVPAFTPVLEER